MKEKDNCKLKCFYCSFCKLLIMQFTSFPKLVLQNLAKLGFRFRINQTRRYRRAPKGTAFQFYSIAFIPYFINSDVHSKASSMLA
jgi:hypothetical protein